MEYVCTKCNNSGFYNGMQCSCVIERALASWLNSILVKTPKIAKDRRPPFEVINSERFRSVVFTCDRMEFDSLVKYYLSYQYINTVGRYTYKYLTGREVVDSFLISGSDGDEVEREITNCDFLILILGNDPNNKYMEELLPYLVSQRHSNGKKTWVYLPPSAYNSVHLKYGQNFANRMSKGNSECIFELCMSALPTKK